MCASLYACLYTYVYTYFMLLLADILVPPELLASCKMVNEGSDGWMWDPFLADLRHEYVDCVGSDGHVPEIIPITQKVVVEGQELLSSMHFITFLYTCRTE